MQYPSSIATSAAALLLLVPFADIADPTSHAIVLEEILAQVPIARDDVELLVPVTLDGRQYTFAFDTGAGVTVLDKSLRQHLTTPIDTVSVQIPECTIELERYRAPDLRIGKVLLNASDLVAVADLSNMSHVVGKQVHGVLGMDFLSKLVVRIDMGQGNLTILRSVGADPGGSIPLFREKGGVPFIYATLPAGRREKFVVDTGHSGSGDMNKDLFDMLLVNGNAKEIRGGLTCALSGNRQMRRARVNALTLAQFDQRHLVFGLGPENLLRLGYLSRFVITFDFPHAAMYVNKGERYNNPDEIDQSGLHLVRIGGRTSVYAVDKGSPAEVCGIKPMDQIIRIENRDAEKLSLSRIREVFSCNGKEVAIVLRRGNNEEVTIPLILGSWEN